VPAVNERLLRPALAVTTAVLLVVGLVGLFVVKDVAMRTVVATFSEAPGLYPGNHVEVLGIPVGSVESVSPGPTGVAVKMSVFSSVPLPRTVDAELMAPEVVSDRYVALTPAYTSGPELEGPATIPLARTAVPVSVDQVLDTVDQLVKALGPTGANQNGALSGLLTQLAKVLGHEGPNLNASITNLGAALGALSNDGPQLTGLLDHLGALSKAAASDGSNYESFASDLAAVSTELAADNGDISGALHNLQTALGQLTTFVADNRSSLGGSAADLETFAATLAKEQNELAQTLTISPLALQNFANAIDPTAPGGGAIRVRYDATPATTAINGPVCGNTLLRLLIVTTAGQPGEKATPSPLDLICGFSSAVNALGDAPGTSTGPNVSLTALVGGAR
jgi:phospholipid/cholesterol/gamma-HCH transport system substrate-binding protein